MRRWVSAGRLLARAETSGIRRDALIAVLALVGGALIAGAMSERMIFLRLRDDVVREVGEVRQAHNLVPVVGALDQLEIRQQLGNSAYLAMDADGRRIAGNLLSAPPATDLTLTEPRAMRVTAPEGEARILGQWARLEGVDLLVGRRLRIHWMIWAGLTAAVLVAAYAVAVMIRRRERQKFRQLNAELDQLLTSFRDNALTSRGFDPTQKPDLAGMRDIGEKFLKALQDLAQTRQFERGLLRTVHHDTLTHLKETIDRLALAGATDREMAAITRDFEIAERNLDALISVIRYSESNQDLLWEIDLVRLAHDIHAEALSYAESEDVGLGLQILGDEETLLALGSESPARIACFNLLRNAVRYTEKGTCVTILCGRDKQGQPFIAFQDRGPGLSGFHPDYSPDRLIDRPLRGPAGMEKDGSGLGLISVQAYCRFLRAKLSHANRVDGRGHEARITFECAERRE